LITSQFLSTGDAQDFGDLIGINFQYLACSNSTRGVFAGGFNPASPTVVNTIDFITIATQEMHKTLVI
jgi:hypothetical protein